jgi:hypothetical protein
MDTKFSKQPLSIIRFKEEKNFLLCWSHDIEAVLIIGSAYFCLLDRAVRDHLMKIVSFEWSQPSRNLSFHVPDDRIQKQVFF